MEPWRFRNRKPWRQFLIVWRVCLPRKSASNISFLIFTKLFLVQHKVNWRKIEWRSFCNANSSRWGGSACLENRHLKQVFFSLFCSWYFLKVLKKGMNYVFVSDFSASVASVRKFWPMYWTDFFGCLSYLAAFQEFWMKFFIPFVEEMLFSFW